jgi:hypothetical protein
VEIGLPFITPEKEELYRKHSVKFKAFVHETLEEILYEHAHNPEVVTMEMTVLDGEHIVAVSYFDIGVDSMASLLCVYDEAYSRFSPGHYTMLREIEYARTRNVKYYYPGYVLDQPSSFDYKLTLGALERLTKEKVWVKSVDYVRGVSTADVIRHKMKELKVMLSSAGIASEFRVYPYFSLSFVMPARAHLLHFPCYYEFNIGAKTYAAAYDVLNNKFAVCRIQETSEIVFRHHLLLSEEYQQSHVYELRVMRSYKATSWKVFVEQLNERNKLEEKAIWK